MSDGNQEAAVSERKTCATAAEVGRPQLPSQPNNVNDGTAVPKSASKKIVPLSAAVSARVEKVVLEDPKEEAMTQSANVSPCPPMETYLDNQGVNDRCSGSNGASDSESGDESDSESDDESGDDSNNDSEEGEEHEQKKADAEKGGVSTARFSPLNTPVCNVGDKEYRLQMASPKKLRVEIPKMTLPLQVSPVDSKPAEPRNLPEPKQSGESMEPHQKKTPDTSSSVQTSSDQVPSSLTQQPLTETIVEEVPLCMTPPQFQSQPHTIGFGQSDVEELFNGADDKQDTTNNWWALADEISRKTLMDPVSSEILTREEPVKGQGNITLGPVSLDAALRAMCVTKIMREVGGLSGMVPPIELAYTFNGEVVIPVGTDQKQLYSLDTFPGDWTTLQSFPNLLRAIVMSAALQSLDPTDLSRFWITSEKRVVCLPSTTGRVEMKIHPMDLLLAVPEMAYKDSPNKAYGVQYYNQFPKHFLRPYGEIRDPVDEDTILKDIKPINCEYLCRPKIALSEMAETCSKNFERAIDTLRVWELEDVKGKVEEYVEKVKILNTCTELPVTHENVVDEMKWHATQNEQFLSLMEDLEIVGNMFYTTAIRFKTLRALICNPAIFAQKLHMANGADADFKKDPSIKNMKELFIKEVVTEHLRKVLVQKISRGIYY